MRKLCTYLAIILLANVSFLFSPKEFPADAIQKWGDFYIPLNKLMGVRVNGDAFAFVSLAIRPSGLLEKNQVRQSRPGYILASNLVGSVIYAGSYPFHDQLESFFQSRISDKYPPKEKEKIARWFSFYTAGVVINMLLLLLSLFLFDKLVVHFSGPWKNAAIHYLFLFLLVANPVTKLFFWSPHVQMFNILTPILMVATSVYLSALPEKTSRFYLCSAVSGILLLFYGSFLLLFPVLLWNSRNKKAKEIIGIILLYSLPVLLWMGFIRLQGIPFYSAEISAYRQFIWIADSLQLSMGSFFSAFLRNTISFVHSLSSLFIPALILIGALVFSRKQSGILQIPPEVKKQVVPTLLFCLLFFWMMGYYADRLSFSMVGILYLISALYFNSRPIARSATMILWTLALASHFLLIAGNPSYFWPTYFN